VFLTKNHRAVDSAKVEPIMAVLKARKEAVDSSRLLMVPFTTLTDYLWLLRASAATMASLGPRAMLYLAAAVSDFYIPTDELVRTELMINLCVFSL